MAQTTYNQMQSGDSFVEVAPSGDVTITNNKTNIGITFKAADFESICSGYPGLKTPATPGR